MFSPEERTAFWRGLWRAFITGGGTYFVTLQTMQVTTGEWEWLAAGIVAGGAFFLHLAGRVQEGRMDTQLARIPSTPQAAAHKVEERQGNDE